MKLKITVIALVMTILLTGCKETSKTDDTKNQMYAKEMNTIINNEAYGEVIGEILTYREFDDTAKRLIRKRYLNVVSEAVFEQLETLNNNQKLVYAGNESDIVAENEENEYPIYDKNYNVVDYGDIESHRESVADFYTNDLNTIENVESSDSLLIVKVNNRYNGVFYVYATIQRGMITYINILK